MDAEQQRDEQAALKRVRDMALTGWYADCRAIEADFRQSADYTLIRPWFQDEMFRAQINELCAKAYTDDAAIEGG